MSLEARKPKPEARNLSATLTPSELAALLGPCVTPVAEPATVTPEITIFRWTSFAEDFARRLTARLRPLIRAAARVTFRDGRTLTVESLELSPDSTSVVRFWQSSRSIEPFAVTFSSPLVSTFVDRLLGDRLTSNRDEAELHRPLTEVDARLASRLIDAVRECVSESVATRDTLDLSDAQTAALSFAEAWLPDSSVVRLTFELRFVQGGGSLDLLLPLEVAETFADPPSAGNSLTASTVSPSPANPSKRATVVAQLVPTSLSRDDLQSLAVGDVLLTGLATDPSLRVFLDGQPRFRAIAGTIEGHKAVRLTTADVR